MSLSHRYQNFGAKKAPDSQQNSIENEQHEEEKLKSFESGYQAGWDDAIKAQSEEQARISQELTTAIQELSHSKQDALTQLTASLQPLISLIIEKLLPEMARESLGMHVSGQIYQILAEQVESPIELVVSPQQETAVNALVRKNLQTEVTVTGDASLSSGQAFVKMGQAEKQVDLDAVVQGISEAMKSFFHESLSEKKEV